VSSVPRQHSTSHSTVAQALGFSQGAVQDKRLDERVSGMSTQGMLEKQTVTCGLGGGAR
jgi:hypothetical protein